jgi:hypothetical protein
MPQHHPDDIPPYGTASYGEPRRGPAQREQVATRKRVIASMERSLRSLLVALGRDYEWCGKAACARSRRCRGFACEPEIADQR